MSIITIKYPKRQRHSRVSKVASQEVKLSSYPVYSFIVSLLVGDDGVDKSFHGRRMTKFIVEFLHIWWSYFLLRCFFLTLITLLCFFGAFLHQDPLLSSNCVWYRLCLPILIKLSTESSNSRSNSTCVKIFVIRSSYGNQAPHFLWH